MNPLTELTELLESFPGEKLETTITRADHQPADLLPEGYRELLAHNHHMTVTMERYHDERVNVEVLTERYDEENNLYLRTSLLRTSTTDRVVQFGVVRFKFDTVSEAVKDEILAKQTPLGRVLIDHNVFRHVDLGALLKLRCGPRLSKIFDCEPETVTYGRLATIFCNGHSAVDLLEVSCPLDG